MRACVCVCHVSLRVVFPPSASSSYNALRLRRAAVCKCAQQYGDTRGPLVPVVCARRQLQALPPHHTEPPQPQSPHISHMHRRDLSSSGSGSSRMPACTTLQPGIRFYIFLLRPRACTQGPASCALLRGGETFAAEYAISRRSVECPFRRRAAFYSRPGLLMYM